MHHLAAEWASEYPNGASEEQAQFWLEQKGVWALLTDTLKAVLVQLWHDGYEKGLGTSPYKAAVTAQVNAFAAQWLRQIVRVTLRILATALVAGTSLNKAMTPERAHMIALTEFQRAKNQAILDQLNAAGVMRIRWICFPGCCDMCQMNDDASKDGWPLGEPFPSGALAPPDHPNCRCHIERA